MTAWQPIKTAPKDGTLMLATWQDSWSDTGTTSIHVHIEAVGCDSGSWFFAYDGDTPARPPTHWMPLPVPPEITP